MKKEKNPSYESALDQLREIVESLQAETIGIDELTEKIQRAQELIAYCRQRLRTTQEEVGKVLGQ